MKVANPLFEGTVPSVFVPSLKVTVPVGTTPPPMASAVAVKVRCLRRRSDSSEEVDRGGLVSFATVMLTALEVLVL